ncbi:MAG TPA: caspase family protein, partial [Thermodesulfovibrionia bacterium]|nr:caspase family protein [Thermodesulfovibrionia bacterium]
MNRRVFTMLLTSLSVLTAGLCLLLFSKKTYGAIPYYDNSYALVIGIGKYDASKWEDLDNAVKDAKSVAEILQSQGFQVTALYNEEAKRSSILKEQNDLARKLKHNDRVVFFFAGHGHTEEVGGEDFGYIVPYDGTGTETYISMDELRSQSKKLGTAKHLLFLIDSCYGGLLVKRSGAIPESIPDYL